MPLFRLLEPFDDPEWIFELKYDGFRALAYVNGGGAKLVSRRNLIYKRFDDLASNLALEVNADDAVLDGEIVKLDESGRPIFLDLMRRRGPFCFVAFDLLAVNGRGLRKLPLIRSNEQEIEKGASRRRKGLRHFAMGMGVGKAVR